MLGQLQKLYSFFFTVNIKLIETVKITVLKYTKRRFNVVKKSQKFKKEDNFCSGEQK